MMRAFLAAATAVLMASGPALPRTQETPKPPQEPPKKDAMELACTAVPTRNRPSLRLEGQAPTLPDGVILGVELITVRERAAGPNLTTGGTACHTDRVKLQRKKIAYTSPAGTPPGFYRVVLRLMDDLQGTRSRGALKDAGTMVPQEWAFDFAAWGDELAGRLSPALVEFDGLVTEARTQIARFEKATSSKPLWEAEGKNLDRDISRLMNDIERSEAKQFYPAAGGEVNSILGSVQSNSRYCVFGADGKLEKVRNYHNPDDKATTHRQEEFNWDNFKKYLDESLEIAGREYALWVIKDTRRAGRVTEGLVKAVKDQAGHAGVSLYVNRLQEGDRLDELEAIVRQPKK